MNNVVHAERIFARFKQDEFDLINESMDLFDVTVATKTLFNNSWFMTNQMNVFVIMGSIECVSRDTVHTFTEMALDYARKRRKEFSRTVKSVTACYSILISPSIEDEARKWVLQKPCNHFRLFELPVLLDSLNNSLFYYRKTVGREPTHYRFLQDFVQKYFIGA